MLLTKHTVTSLRSRVQSALKRADELTSELCPSPKKFPAVPDDVTALTDLMIADAVEMLSSAGYVLQQVEPKLTDDPKTHKLSSSDIGLLARADQKINHCFDLLNQAMQMIEGQRSVWGQEIRRSPMWDK
jgi:hypothetical protein